MRFNSTGAMLAFLGLIAAFILIFIIVFLINKKRKKGIKDYCEANGIKYEESSYSIPDCKEKFRATSIGGSTTFTSIMSGERAGINYCILDYQGTVNTRRGVNNYCSTICLLSKSGIVFPTFYIRPEMRLTDMLNEKLGMQDIDFDEDKEFSNKYVLQGPNEKEIRNYFTPEIRKAFVDAYANKYNFIEASNDFFLVSQNNHLTIKDRMDLLKNSIKLYSAVAPTDNKDNNPA